MRKTILMLAGCGLLLFALSCGDPPGDDDDDSVTPTPTPTATPDTVAPDTDLDAGPVTNDPRPLIRMVFSSPDSDVTGYECSLDGAAFASCSSPEVVQGLADGSHDFSVRAIDGSANVDDTPATVSWTKIPGTQIDVTNQGAMAYTIDGTNGNPVVNVTRGNAYWFRVVAPGHPFYVKTVQSTGSGGAYSDGLDFNGTSNGDIVWIVPGNAPDTLFYNCSIHAMMTGTISVSN